MNGAATRLQLEKAAEARARETRDLVTRHMPEAVSFIRELYQCGLIEGWRNVHSFRFLKEGPQP